VIADSVPPTGPAVGSHVGLGGYLGCASVPQDLEGCRRAVAGGENAVDSEKLCPTSVFLLWDGGALVSG
jgi:hypothetical protein